MITDEQIKEMQDAPELAVWEAIQAYNKARDYLNDTSIVTRYQAELEDMALDLGNKLSQHFLDVSV
ncbi:MAG TPA: hypothetical protein ENI27_06710 [bacterium]|nr:hypothetical protein [bacterium]